jgi:hypothetical protein
MVQVVYLVLTSFIRHAIFPVKANGDNSEPLINGFDQPTLTGHAWPKGNQNPARRRANINNRETAMWKSIDTAPKDGKSFLAYYGMSDDPVPTPMVLVVSWSDYTKSFEPDYFTSDDLETRPVSWYPLPAPPELT